MDTFRIDDFFLNSCVLCTGLFLIHQIFRRFNISKRSSIQGKIVAGLIQGLFGTLLMRYGIHMEGNVLIDLRVVPIMVASQVGGYTSSILAALLIAVARLAFYPFSTSSYLNVFILAASGIAFAIISNSNLKSKTQWYLMSIFFMTLIGSTIWIVVQPLNKMILLFVQYSLAVFYGSYIARLVESFLEKSESTLQKLNEEAQTDFLTGLHNVRSFDREMATAYEMARDQNEPLSLLLIDIDHFKIINDTYGHPAGDAVLRRLSAILMRQCRQNDIISRNGGEEFSVILPACDLQLARVVAERIRAAVERSLFVVGEGTELRITVSIGISTISDFEDMEIHSMIHDADEGLYFAKRTGRNRIATYSTT